MRASAAGQGDARIGDVAQECVLERVLGFAGQRRVRSDDDEPFCLEPVEGGFELGLVPEATPGTSGPQPLWGVQNAEAAYARLVELGATPLEPVTAVGEGIKVAAVTDPFGNRFGIIENPHFNVANVR